MTFFCDCLLRRVLSHTHYMFTCKGSTRHGPFTCRASHIHFGAKIISRQTLRLLLPRRLPQPVSTSTPNHHKSICVMPFFVFVFRAAKMDDALERMKQVIRWYLSGFYKKPKVCIAARSLNVLVFKVSCFLLF